MSSSFNLYPVLTSDKIQKSIKGPADLSFSYNDNGENYRLLLENKTEDQFIYSAELRDPRCDWYPETHDLQMNMSLTITDPSSWFGVNGVAPVNSTLGIAQQWISSKSDLRGIIQVGEVKCNDKDIELYSQHIFPQNSIKGSLLIKTILYLKSVVDVQNEEKFLCSQTGTVLGEIDNCEIYVDGNGSVFPIATISDAKQPLWTLYFDDTCDPMQDAFDHEHVEIRLNRAHPNYEQLKIDSSLKESPLFLEVISSALMIILESSKELLGPDWGSVISSQSDFERGSIAEAINYFVVKLGWDISSPSKLAQSIHKFFDENLQGGSL